MSTNLIGHPAAHPNDPIILSHLELNALIEAAVEKGIEKGAEKGAERALARLGLADGNAVRDIAEWRSLVDAYRAIRHGMLRTIGQMMAAGIITALLTYFYFKR